MKLLLVDDHEMVRLGLKSYLSMQDGIDQVLEASDGQAGVELALTRATRCHHYGYCHAPYDRD